MRPMRRWTSTRSCRSPAPRSATTRGGSPTWCATGWKAMSDNRPGRESLTGAQRAAVVLLSLGEAQAAEVLKHMGPREVQKLGMAMTTVSAVGRDTVAEVFDDFVDSLAQPAAIGAGADDYIRAVLTQALGEERADRK